MIIVDMIIQYAWFKVMICDFIYRFAIILSCLNEKNQDLVFNFVCLHWLYLKHFIVMVFYQNFPTTRWHFLSAAFKFGIKNICITLYPARVDVLVLHVLSICLLPIAFLYLKTLLLGNFSVNIFEAFFVSFFVYRFCVIVIYFGIVFFCF